MKKPYIVTLGALIILILAGLIAASIKSANEYNFANTAEDTLSELLKNQHFIAPSEALEIKMNGPDNVLFVDLRNPREFDNYHIEGATNIPMQQVLNTSNKSTWQNAKMKILYSDTSIEAAQALTLLTQYGYQNIRVLQGGANYWKNHTGRQNLFSPAGEYDDEKPLFDRP